jgi:hypothetical protein
VCFCAIDDFREMERDGTGIDAGVVCVGDEPAIRADQHDRARFSPHTGLVYCAVKRPRVFASDGIAEAGVTGKGRGGLCKLASSAVQNTMQHAFTDADLPGELLLCNGLMVGANEQERHHLHDDEQKGAKRGNAPFQTKEGQRCSFANDFRL